MKFISVICVIKNRQSNKFYFMYTVFYHNKYDYCLLIQCNLPGKTDTLFEFVGD